MFWGIVFVLACCVGFLWGCVPGLIEREKKLKEEVEKGKDREKGLQVLFDECNAALCESRKEADAKHFELREAAEKLQASEMDCEAKRLALIECGREIDRLNKQAAMLEQDLRYANASKDLNEKKNNQFEIAMRDIHRVMNGVIPL